jgi:hypothetical protein
LDSHADTCIAGPNCIIKEYTNQVANVSACSDIYDELTNVLIITVATAYNDPTTGVTFITIIGQALYLGDKVSNTLLCPNQLRDYGIIVDDVPAHLSLKDRPSTHSIYIPDGNISIPSKFHGIISHFESCTPTKQEIDTFK